MREETLANIPRLGSTAPVSSTMTFSEKRVIFVSYDQRSPHDTLSLSLYLFRTHGIPLIVQHLPACCLQPQTLIVGKMLAALEVLQNLMMTMSENRDVLATDAAVKLPRLCRNICGPSHKKPAACLPHHLHFAIPFWPHSPPGFTHITPFAACVAGATPSRKNTRRPSFHLLQLAQNII